MTIRSWSVSCPRCHYLVDDVARFAPDSIPQHFDMRNVCRYLSFTRDFNALIYCFINAETMGTLDTDM